MDVLPFTHLDAASLQVVVLGINAAAHTHHDLVAPEVQLPLGLQRSSTRRLLRQPVPNEHHLPVCDRADLRPEAVVLLVARPVALENPGSSPLFEVDGEGLRGDEALAVYGEPVRAMSRRKAATVAVPPSLTA